MRILLINDHLGRSGGTETITHSLKDALKKRGHVVELFGSEKGENFASLFSRWYSLKWYRKTVNKIKEFNPDVIHVNNCMRVISPSVIDASFKMRVPVVLTLHDLYYICPRVGGIYEKNRPKKYKWRHICFSKYCVGFREKYSDFPRNFWRLLKLLLHRKVVKNRKIIFTSSAKFVIKTVGDSLGIKAKIVRWGTNVPKKGTSYKKNIIFVGEINKEKGLGSIASVLNEVKGYKVFALGKGPLKERLEKKYKNIKFLGFRDPKEYYENASIFVMPPIWQEPGGLAITEAMSYGICVLASNIGGISEQVKNMEKGLLFEPGNKQDFKKKLDYLLKNPKEIKRMGKNGRIFVKKNFNSENLAKNFEKVYLEAIRNNKK